MSMQKVQIDGLEVSRLCLGGGKMENMDIHHGRAMVNKAKELGINIFDAHHRYGNCEGILGSFHDILFMSKISAYQLETADTLINKTILNLQRVPDIYWVSDLDDATLYGRGDIIYHALQVQSRWPVKRLGITTESPEMGFRFLKEHPECMYYMLPLHLNQSQRMFDLAKEIKKQDKYLFVIKPFNDMKGTKHPIKASLKLCIDKGVDVICIGTKNIDHLIETVNIFNEIYDEM